MFPFIAYSNAAKVNVSSRHFTYFQRAGNAPFPRIFSDLNLSAWWTVDSAQIMTDVRASDTRIRIQIWTIHVYLQQFMHGYIF